VDSFATSNGVNGTIPFTDVDSSDTQSASFTPAGSNYVGTFSLDLVSASNGSSSVNFEFSLGDNAINLAPGETLTQSYGVSITDAQNSAANVNQTVSVSIGGPGNDNFVFQPSIGADTIVNFNPQNDTIELDHFANAQTVQQLQSLITTDSHGDAIIELGHNDSITLAHVQITDLHASNFIIHA
jgi:VCBS repeat-containing protein